MGLRRVFIGTPLSFIVVFIKALYIQEPALPMKLGKAKDLVLAGAKGDIYASLIEERVLPELRAYKPELIMISAGFDAHHRDPLAGVLLEDEDFGMLADKVLKVAEGLCGGSVVSVLEGGYDLEWLAGGVEQLVRRQLEFSC
jgi:acetoin utilization deacetylase AcuC-like enzyme